MLARCLFWLALVALPIGAAAKPEQLPAACARLLDHRLPGWEPASVDLDAATWAQSQRLNPIVTAGDYNGDGKKDWAALVTANGKKLAAVCLSRAKRKQILFIEVAGQDNSALLMTARAGTRQRNLDTGGTERLRHDALITLWFEKAGNTYVYEHGGFRRFGHSD